MSASRGCPLPCFRACASLWWCSALATGRLPPFCRKPGEARWSSPGVGECAGPRPSCVLFPSAAVQWVFFLYPFPASFLLPLLRLFRSPPPLPAHWWFADAWASGAPMVQAWRWLAWSHRRRPRGWRGGRGLGQRPGGGFRTGSGAWRRWGVVVLGAQGAGEELFESVEAVLPPPPPPACPVCPAHPATELTQGGGGTTK